MPPKDTRNRRLTWKKLLRDVVPSGPNRIPTGAIADAADEHRKRLGGETPITPARVSHFRAGGKQATMRVPSTQIEAHAIVFALEDLQCWPDPDGEKAANDKRRLVTILGFEFDPKLADRRFDPGIVESVRERGVLFLTSRLQELDAPRTVIVMDSCVGYIGVDQELRSALRGLLLEGLRLLFILRPLYSEGEASRHSAIDATRQLIGTWFDPIEMVDVKPRLFQAKGGEVRHLGAFVTRFGLVLELDARSGETDVVDLEMLHSGTPRGCWVESGERGSEWGMRVAIEGQRYQRYFNWIDPPEMPTGTALRWDGGVFDDIDEPRSLWPSGR